ncbi:molybdenum cofactor guanylyltransferase [Dyella dinghuensis]|uniref:Molybdenum cofactor guanylyltransferase n=1 Tax=Dyella dinghuensis TaxID=1920169 RepID=A0A432LWN9_9GAMM|nr:molybdenum cofactor guanylyltransferase [Dyella dinghuensis]RUL66508.1 molybdenum cofactor guanylyltransferase [Dyella dinghuensis]
MDTGTDATRYIGVVLAGGLSSRMGRDKAMLPWQGRPLIERQIAVLREAGVETVHVSGERADYRGVADPVAHAGPLGGIAGIAAMCDDGELLVIPVDMPRLHSTLLQRLLVAPAAGCVHFAGHILPMRLRLDGTCRAVLAELMSAADDRSRSLRALQERVGVLELPLGETDAGQLIDCNTEETWREVTG